MEEARRAATASAEMAKAREPSARALSAALPASRIAEGLSARRHHRRAC